MILAKTLNTWKENEKGEVELVREENTIDIFGNAWNTSSIIKANHRNRDITHVPPYKDFHHFVQRTKPWLNREISQNPYGHVDIPKSPYELWFNTLRKIEAEYKFGINTTNVWNGKPTLGTFPANSMVQQSKDNKVQLG